MRVVFAPFTPWEVLAAFFLAAIALAAFSLYRRSPGAVWRSLCMAALLAAIANPSVVRERRETLPDVVAVIVDQSPSQELNGRMTQADEATEQLRRRLAAIPDLDVRVMATTGSASGTRLFDAAENLLLDTAADRVAGVIMVTDGQVHDVPPPELQASLPGPVHVLLTGSPGRADRRLNVTRAPKFGIVGETQSLTVRVEDSDPLTAGTAVDVRLSLNGGAPVLHRLPVGQDREILFQLGHAGANVLELEVDAASQELTERNNRVALMVNGVRDRLRVLLVSGEPHPGERTWRDLLRADPAVDMVHFTILRPPEKQDGTPVGELSLISFPTRELFSLKLHEFDLIIFDRYRRRGVLPFIYFDNIANYVEQGGAVLSAAGPAFASSRSLYRTPLAIVFPGQPTGEIRTGGFKPMVTELGARHPVTEGLPGANRFSDGREEATDPTWGRWFRVIDVAQLGGKELLAAPTGESLLLLDDVGQGRVAQLLSDHGWLWARGFEGGGPQAELLRRLAHWLMKEPDLEEEDLRAEYRDGRINIHRRSLSTSHVPVLVEYPDGHTQMVDLEEQSPGRWRGQVQAAEPGIYRLRDGWRNTIVAAGQTNPVEFADVRATDTLVAPAVEETGGGLFWLAADGLPDIRRRKAGRDMAGRNWLGLRENGRYLVEALEQHPLLPGLIILSLIGGTLGFAWRAEGR